MFYFLLFGTTLQRLYSGTFHFDLIWIMTKGGPLQSTYVPGFLIFEKGIQRFDFGYASSLSILMVVIVLIVIGLYALISKKENTNA